MYNYYGIYTPQVSHEIDLLLSNTNNKCVHQLFIYLTTIAINQREEPITPESLMARLDLTEDKLDEAVNTLCKLGYLYNDGAKWVLKVKGKNPHELKRLKGKTIDYEVYVAQEWRK
jgi:hypothetical protein